MRREISNEPLRRARARARQPKARKALSFAAALLAVGALGPLAGIALGRANSSGKTTTVETVCNTTTTATTTTPASYSTVVFNSPPTSEPTYNAGTMITPVQLSATATSPTGTASSPTYGAVDLPDGLTINPSTGDITGTVLGTTAPNVQGTITSTIVATAADGGSSSIEISWTVTGTTTVTPASSSIVSFTAVPQGQTNTIGSSVSEQVTATDNEGAAVTYGALGLPAGLAINPSTGLISGVLSSTAVSGTATVIATATDGSTASSAISWTIAPASNPCTTTTITIPPYVPPVNTSTAPPTIAVPSNEPFKGQAMWIWEMSATDRGNVAAIIAQAKADHISTLIIKGGDGTTAWSQFNKPLVQEIHAAGLKVCDWQYVYGVHPGEEASVGAIAKKDGANCLVIDAEVQYQGRYTSAATYVKDLRSKIGKGFAVGLAGLPYIGYHVSFPYSIFLGPNGAQYNLPQMYWIDIGTSVPYVFDTTYDYNEIYKRPIFPLGQLYSDSEGSPNLLSIGQFETIATDYHAKGTSWWDFQSAQSSWIADTDTKSAAPAGFVISTNAVTLVRGNVGDMVIWAQEHLDGAGQRIAVDGDFGPSTVTAVEAFQAAHGLAVSGQITGLTWDALLRYTPVTVTWSLRGKKLYATIPRRGANPAIRSIVTL